MNNRQAGRRRGRGGQRQQGGSPTNQGNGNRIDNRARGNAAQLLEKYKNLARDCQMQGDRVNAEYYLQFADHYFRVLAETRSRFEENNPNQNHPQQRRPSTDLEDDDFPDHIDGPEVDLSALLVETLALAIDPYPRLPEESLDSIGQLERNLASGPFAALAKLKGGTEG